MPLTLRLALTYLVLTLAGLLLLGAGFMTLAGRSLSQQRERELAGQADIYAALIGELADTSTEFQALAASGLGSDLLPAGTAARFFSMAGTLLAGDSALGPFPSRPALALVRPPVLLPASQAHDRYFTARQVMGPAGAIGVVELSRSTTEDDQLLAGLRALTLQVALGAALLMALSSIIVARTIARPVLQQARRAEELAALVDRHPASGTLLAADPALQQNRAVRSRSSRGDEIAQLAATLSRLEAGLRAYTERIADLEQARTRFYRSVSHELRTPLTAIRGTIENLVDQAPDDQGPALVSLEGEVDRLSRLVDELLRPPGNGQLLLSERRSFDLAALATELCALLVGRVRRAGLELDCVALEPLMLIGDRDRIKQALLNLLDNALRVTPAGGRVELAAERMAARVRISVSDSGPGIPTELRARIWERGVRGDATTAGSSGLGLAIVREIITAHGGRVSIDEDYTAGARFVIELPAHEGQ